MAYAEVRAGNEQCRLFCEHVSVFVALPGFRSLNVFVSRFGCVRCSCTVVLCLVPGPGVVLTKMIIMYDDHI